MMVKLQQQQSSRIWLERRSLRVHEKILRVTYIQNCTHVCRRSRIVWEVQCQSRFQWRRRRRKTVNVFGISRASVSAIIKRVSYAITTFLGPEPIKLPTTENKLKELTNKLLETRVSSMHRDNTWHPYWDSRTRWTLLGLYKQKELFFLKRSSCARPRIFYSKCSYKMARKRAWFS